MYQLYIYCSVFEQFISIQLISHFHSSMWKLFGAYCVQSFRLVYLNKRLHKIANFWAVKNIEHEICLLIYAEELIKMS